MFSKKKYSCCFCSNLDKVSSKKFNLCKDCKKIHNFIRERGINTLLDFIECKTDKIIASAPPNY
jgi:hypothetical protein